MKFSPMKRNIILLIIRDTDMANVIDIIKLYLTITTEQVFYIIDYLLDKQWIGFKEGKLILTIHGYDALENSNLDGFSLKNIEEYKYKVNESYLKDYIPKNI